MDPLSTKSELESRLQVAVSICTDVHREVNELAAQERVLYAKLEAARKRLRLASEAEDRARAELKAITDIPAILP